MYIIFESAKVLIPINDLRTLAPKRKSFKSFVIIVRKFITHEIFIIRKINTKYFYARHFSSEEIFSIPLFCSYIYHICRMQMLKLLPRIA